MKTIYAIWRHVPDPAFRVLAYMGLVSLDSDTPPAYWGGREALAMCMGREAPHTDADWRAVTRALHQLRTAGAVVFKGHSAMTNARYELQLDPTALDVERPVNTGRGTSSEQGTPGDRDTGRRATRQGTPSDRTGDAERPLKENQEPTGLTRGRTTHAPASSSDRANPAAMDGMHDLGQGAA